LNSNVFDVFFLLQFKLSLSDDGSGKGAAMVACVAEHQPDKETSDYEKVEKIVLN
jgi:hypothetical protein